MKIIKPKKLKKNDTIGILAVSGRIKEIENIEKAKKFLEKEGYNVKVSDTCYNSHRYMAGNSDDECIKEFHKFFLDKSIDAILCARGGYGTLRLINKIDWNIVKDNPKIFAGYSDITILLAMMYKKCSLVTFHSAMANGDFACDIEEYTKNSFFDALEGKTVKITAENVKTYKEGEAEGILWGGNLSSLVSLCGIDFIPEENIILFLEDLNEPVYKIDKMLTQLFNIDKLKRNVKGIVLGEFKNIDDIDWFDSLIEEFSLRLNIPISSGYKITHNKVKDTVPYGVKVIYNTLQGKINIREEYVK